MRKEYKIISSITGGLNETYKTYEDIKKRYEYIKSNKEEFKKNSMLYFYSYVYNEEDKIVKDKTLGIIKF